MELGNEQALWHGDKVQQGVRGVQGQEQQHRLSALHRHYSVIRAQGASTRVLAAHVINVEALHIILLLRRCVTGQVAALHVAQRLCSALVGGQVVEGPSDALGVGVVVRARVGCAAHQWACAYP